MFAFLKKLFGVEAAKSEAQVAPYKVEQPVRPAQERPSTHATADTPKRVVASVEVVQPGIAKQPAKQPAKKPGAKKPAAKQPAKKPAAKQPAKKPAAQKPAAKKPAQKKK